MWTLPGYRGIQAQGCNKSSGKARWKVKSTSRPSKMVQISWLCHYIHYLSIPQSEPTDPIPFRGTHCTYVKVISSFPIFFYLYFFLFGFLIIKEEGHLRHIHHWLGEPSKKNLVHWKFKFFFLLYISCFKKLILTWRKNSIMP